MASAEVESEMSELKLALPKAELGREHQASIIRLMLTGDEELKNVITSQEVDVNSFLTIKTNLHCDCAADYEYSPGTYVLAAEQDVDNDSDALDDALMFRGICPCLWFEGDESAPTQVAGVPLIHMAVNLGKMWIVKFLLERNVDLKEMSLREKRSILHAALSSCCKSEVLLDMVTLLVEAGCDLDAQDKEHQTPLMKALELVDVSNALLDVLIKGGCNLNLQDSSGKTALHQAIVARDMDMVETLLTAGAKTDTVDNAHRSPLITAIQYINIDLVRRLIQANCDVNFHKLDDDAPIHIAVFRGHRDILKLLLEAGADPDRPTQTGHTALMIAATNSSRSMAEMLLKYNAKVNCVENHGYMAIHLAAWDGRSEFVQMLLDAGSEFDSRTEDKNTPMALACHGNYVSVIKQLIYLGCDVNNQDKDLDTPLLYCTYNGCLEGVRLLLNKGADPDMANKLNTTPLWNAVHSGKKSVVMLLLQANVRLNIPSVGINQHSGTSNVVQLYAEEQTPLYVACDRSHWDVMKLLVFAGTNLSSESWLSSPQDQMEFHWRNGREEFKWLWEQACNANSLQNCCRYYIRSLLGRRIHAAVETLEIPVSLRSYLLLEEL